MRFLPILVCLLFMHAGPARAQNGMESAPTDAVVLPANTVEVKGVLPGPGFWKISKGDNTLWILASIRPVPKGMQWETIKLERKLADSQLLIGSPSVKLDSELGFFAKVGLVPSLLKARKNPEGKTLQQVLPPETYRRWTVMKQKYIGNDKDIETWRPIFAAQELYEKAIRKAGLSNEGIVWPEAKDLAEDADVPINRPEIKIDIGDPKKFIKEFNRRALNDVACFERTLDTIERDVQFMAERGRLWAVGDVAGLRRISQADFSGACIDALLGSGVAQSAGLGDVQKRALDAWLSASEQALNKHRSSIAVVNFAELVKPNGLLERFAAKGYTVTEPVAVP